MLSTATPAGLGENRITRRVVGASLATWAAVAGILTLVTWLALAQ